ncbi:MAG: carbamate kinase [Deltaproteobacteria bacterium]|nr:carbamate kinase [Deltaproteobacteria bacterium]
MAGKTTTIISLGGNVIIRRHEKGTVEEQFENTRVSCAFIARAIADGENIVITHGNGPIVGNILLRNEAMKENIPPMPLYICDADSEGGIGFMVQQTLYNELLRTGKVKDIVTVVTQVVVDPSDPAFKNPTKPIGPYYTEGDAKRIAREKGWAVKEDSHRGWRRFVASPKPRKVIESNIIKKLSDDGVIVIAAGGGGIPVVENPDSTLSGVDCVIDKDLATSVLAKEIGAGVFINLTQTDMVYLNFGKPGQKGIPEMGVKEAKKYLKEGEFLPGSMQPKIEAAIGFLEAGGREVVITTPEFIEDALKGKAGTRIHL